MNAHRLEMRFAAVVCVGVLTTLLITGCVSEALPQTDEALAELIQSATPSASGRPSDDSSERSDDFSPAPSDTSNSAEMPGAQSSDDSADTSNSTDDSSPGVDDSASSSDNSVSRADDDPNRSDNSAATADASPVPASPRLRATLSGDGAESGHADYRVEDGRRKFTVEVEDFAPGEYAVLINGVEVAVLSVGTLGTAEIEFDSKVEVEHVRFPVGFPAEIQTDDVVSIDGVVGGRFAVDQ
jgi:hypothetical protein